MVQASHANVMERAVHDMRRLKDEWDEVHLDKLIGGAVEQYRSEMEQDGSRTAGGIRCMMGKVLAVLTRESSAAHAVLIQPRLRAKTQDQNVPRFDSDIDALDKTACDVFKRDTGYFSTAVTPGQRDVERIWLMPGRGIESQIAFASATKCTGREATVYYRLEQFYRKETGQVTLRNFLAAQPVRRTFLTQLP